MSSIFFSCGPARTLWESVSCVMGLWRGRGPLEGRSGGVAAARVRVDRWRSVRKRARTAGRGAESRWREREKKKAMTMTECSAEARFFSPHMQCTDVLEWRRRRAESSPWWPGWDGGKWRCPKVSGLPHKSYPWFISKIQMMSNSFSFKFKSYHAHRIRSELNIQRFCFKLVFGPGIRIVNKPRVSQLILESLILSPISLGVTAWFVLILCRFWVASPYFLINRLLTDTFSLPNLLFLFCTIRHYYFKMVDINILWDNERFRGGFRPHFLPTVLDVWVWLPQEEEIFMHNCS